MIRFKKLGYIVLNVTDVERSRRWYESMVGLQFNGTGSEGEVYLRADADHHCLVLCPSTKPGLKRIGWQLESDAQIDALSRALDRHGIPWRALPEAECEAIGMIQPMLRSEDPTTGTTLDFFGSGMKQMSEPFRSTVAKIRYLCHIGICTARYRDTIGFYEHVLNFKTSDEVDGKINLMRCFPNPLHHSLAIAASTSNALHHYNFMVTDQADIVAARTRFEANAIKMVWDGHHPPSGNTFLFFLDPDGLPVEYGHGMELFPEIGARPHRVFTSASPVLSERTKLPDAPVE